MSMFAPTRTHTSRLLVSEGSALLRQAGARRDQLCAAPLARKISYLRAKKDDKDDKSAASEVVADEPAVVVEDTVTAAAKEVVADEGSKKSPDDSAVEAVAEKETVEAKEDAVGAEAVEAGAEAVKMAPCGCCPADEDDEAEQTLKATEETLKGAEEKLKAAELTAESVAEKMNSAMSDFTAKLARETEEASIRDEGNGTGAPPAQEDKDTVAEEPVVATAADAVEEVGEVESAVESTEAVSEVKESSEGRVEIPGATVEYTYKGPEPQRFTVAEGQTGQILGAALNPTFRLFSGAFVQGYSAGLEKADKDKYSVAKAVGRQVDETGKVTEFKRPTQPIELYEYEGCPFCKKVREAVSILDLDVMYYPCPRNGPTFRPKAIELGGKRSFPYMVDPGAGKAMYESDDIIEYLFQEYGDGEVPVGLRLGVFTTLSCGLSLVGRLGKGSSYKEAKMPEQPLIFWAYEGSPFCKVVKEVLCELEIPHLLKSVARGSPKRQELFEVAGHFQVPYIQDPNTGIAMFESTAIIDYLYETYAV